jgi:hypothetical protein
MELAEEGRAAKARKQADLISTTGHQRGWVFKHWRRQLMGLVLVVHEGSSMQ